MNIKQSKTLENIISIGIVLSERGRLANPIDIMFLSMMEEDNCHATHILKKILKDWEIYQFKVRIRRECERSSTMLVDGQQRLKFFADVYNSLESICRECTPRGADFVINTGHFMLYVLRGEDFISSQIAKMYNVDTSVIKDYVMNYPPHEDYYIDMQALDTIRTYRIESALNEDNDDSANTQNGAVRNIKQVPDDADAETRLDKFGTDLTRLARQGAIDPIVGRDKEIERLIQVLGRRKKNNPILIGEAGVGKSAIVEGLAMRIVAHDVPYLLYGKKVFSLDMASLVAGTKYRGEFEERIKQLLKEIENDKNIILFIDEIHTIVGAGSTQGSLDTANILKPALARGEIQCIGATTLDEFRESIESDAALERRFQKILVEPTTREQTLDILKNIKSHYESHHCVRYSDEALVACVELTDRYITDRQFPDKAVDLLDEVGARANVFSLREPERMRKLEVAIEYCATSRREAEAAFVYEDAAHAESSEMVLRNKLEQFRERWNRRKAANPMVITADYVAGVISVMTGIPTSNISQDEKHRLSGIATRLSEHVIGQQKAIDKITKSILRSRSGLNDPSKPVGVFMFVGPTGVGKTLLAKELAAQLFDRQDALVRIDMSEYSEHHNISRLIGSPPGYVGYNEGGQLTERIRRQPYSVILFDEIEKAHPDVFNVMLQIFDDGELTDGLGRKVDFRNTVIVMTSNVGSREIVRRGMSVGFNTSNSDNMERDNKDAVYREALERTFAPEFINRIDDIVIFGTLSDDDVERIVDLELAKLNSRASKLGYDITVSDTARHQLVKMGYQPRYGVRSLKRVILEQIEEPVAQMIVENIINKGDSIDISVNDDKIILLPKAC